MRPVSEFDLLLVIAQVSVAFAGFASLASAFGDRNQRDERRVDAGRLTNMLIVSLNTAMLALIPFIPTFFGGTEKVVWSSSAVTALGASALFAPGTMMRTKRMKQYAGFSVRANILNFCLAGLAAFGFVSCALGFPALRPSASYVAGLVAMLVICAIVFFQVIVSLLRPHAPE
jgi:hypothetical protein